MKRAFRLLLCLFLFVGICTQVWIRTDAQTNRKVLSQSTNNEIQLPFVAAPPFSTRDLSALVLPTLRRDFLLPPLVFTNDTAALLHSAISKRLGVRYRWFGIDDRGYDCSGFVWRVFQDAGANFDRVAARTLWTQLPEAPPEETTQFGTLVFFNGLRHVGIVRDAYTFYHASRSHGVVLSHFAGYWGSRVTGYRRPPQ